MPPELTREQRLHFRDEFRDARAAVLRDTEEYQQILFVLERLGQILIGESGFLWKYETSVIAFVAKYHPFCGSPPGDYRIKFSRLYQMIRYRRNDALHQGAVARNLSVRLVELSLILEDALMAGTEPLKIQDYMMGNPVRAHLWQPIGFIRQSMLANSFTYLPYQKNGKWYVISDQDISQYLWNETPISRSELLSRKLKDVIKCKADPKILKREVILVSPNTSVKCALACAKKQKVAGLPILVKHKDREELLGIVTPFDLL